MLVHLENIDAGASLEAFIPAGYKGSQLVPICSPGLDHAHRNARCLPAATRKLRAAGADLRMWDVPRDQCLDAESVRRVPVHPSRLYRVWLDMTYRLDNEKARELVRAVLDHFGSRLRVLDVNASLVYIATDAYTKHFDDLDADVRTAAKRAAMVVTAHTPPVAYRSTSSNMMRAAYTFTMPTLWQRACGLVASICGRGKAATVVPTLLPQKHRGPTVQASVSKCFLAPGYFCSVKGLDQLVPGKASSQRLTLRMGASGASWPVVFKRGKGLSGGWRRVAADLELALGTRLEFWSAEEGTLNMRVLRGHRPAEERRKPSAWWIA